MATITKYVWDSVNDCVLSELDGSNATTAVYTNEAQLYGGVLSQRRGATSHYHHHDALGATRFLTDSSGTITDTYLYDAWGNSVASTGTTVNPFKWVGKWGYQTDASTGLVYVRARMYQPTVARWTSVDPLSLSLVLHNYGYCGNHTVDYSDPSGLSAIPPHRWPPANPGNTSPPPADPRQHYCDVGLHCYPVVGGLGTHCGLTIDTVIHPVDRPLSEKSPFWIDGGPDKDPVTSCGEELVVSTRPQGIGGTANGPGPVSPYTEYPRMAFPISVCQCLFRNARKLHNLTLIYDPLRGSDGINSNFAAHCLLTSCGLGQSNPKWNPPPGWDDNPPCLEHSRVDAGQGDLCTSEYCCKKRLNCAAL